MKVLTILKSNKEKELKELLEIERKDFKKPKNDIITSCKEEIIIENEDGTKTIKYEEKKTNITRLVNETAKIVKQDEAQRKLEQLRNIIK